MDPGWRPADPVGQMLMLDILERLAQHRAEDTLPRSPRGLFYDLRPDGMGHGLHYVKQPRMITVGRGTRRADPAEIGPIQVQEMLVKLRRAGLVREDWIEDTRAPTPDMPSYNDVTAEDEAAWLVNEIMSPRITYSPQRGQDMFLEMVVEAAGLIGRTARICRPFGVPVYSGGGFDGLKGKRAFAERAADRDVPTVVLRISDLDEHGLRIAESMAEDCVAWAVNEYGADYDQLTFERIALTVAQAEAAGVIDSAGKAEADALPVPVMDAIITEAIEEYQDAQTREDNAREAAEESARVTGLVLAGLRERGTES
jgi:hypothetical protein